MDCTFYHGRDGIDHDLRRTMVAAWLHSPFDDERAKRALTIAGLRGGVDEFEALLARKRQFLASSKNANLADFEAFVTMARDKLARTLGS